ncbi:HAD hydrolase-like protein [Amycolatopsis aidingensis]|uniref:HAD hydrolase-like protein n=1 Tax=Amycolatopsis aidingensis TaxID=2842453 RepID=UPI001C0B02AB|nr:HAD hydrolase-like protein [Amycolatopsis aidingensis]
MSAPQLPSLLVLWDVDHTLIETRGVGRAIYDRAFSEATGKPLVQLAVISGRTELDIMSESLRLNGVEPTEDAVDRLANALVDCYRAMADHLATAGRALPGAQQTLAALAADARVHQGVLTGNLREVARIKLKVFGLDTYLDLEASAYGDDDAHRPRLVRTAQRRATDRTGVAFDNSRTVLIGDTPNDVRAALTAGVRAIAVATGKSTEADLRASGAIDVIPALNPDVVARLLA